MSNLQVFLYNDRQVRTVQHEGELWWVLNDVCEVLELKQPHRVAARLDKDEKGRTFMTTLGGQQEVTIINEPGLYSVILRSNKPEAKAFKRWITHEVLPNIHRTGSYMPQPDPRIDVLIEQVQKLTECLTSLTAQNAKTLGNAELPKRPARRRWMRLFNEKLDMLERNTGYSHSELLNILYPLVEEQCGVDLNEERFTLLERTNLEDCSLLETIFRNEHLRDILERTIDANLASENRGWRSSLGERDQ